MPVTLTDLVSYKRLVAVGNSELWYEDINVAAGTMVELADANADIDTTDQLTMFEAFQKVFVVNGSNLKVADFINTKITCSALTDPPACGDILTQDQGSSKYAYMIVDFVNTAKTAIYGYAYYAGGATAFITTADVSSNDATATMDPNPIPNANISAITSSPHWYDWTVYPDIVLSVAGFGQAAGSTKSFGSMPNKAYLGCLYNGRPVLSGNPEESYQWYMVRQFNPWDFAYIANDAQTPVKGGNSDAGELGDIIRALIPYKDDFLIFGCATTISYMMGDPAAGGAIRELDLTTGIFGAKSWCFDGEGNFYFWGTNGLYATPIPGTPVCISEQSLPDLVSDEAADPSTHRIVLGYDRKRRGILIAITKLSDGSHSNYWYDLRTKGFFPESSASDSHGVYSMFYYPANDEDYRDLLVGCKDGYIRKFDSSTKNDDGTTIDSYVNMGPISLGNTPFTEGSIGPLDIVLGGGGSSGTETDSDDAAFKVFVNDTAAGLVEDLEANGTPVFGGTASGPGRRRGSKKLQSARGVYGGVRIGNNASGEAFIFECLSFGKQPKGRAK